MYPLTRQQVSSACSLEMTPVRPYTLPGAKEKGQLLKFSSIARLSVPPIARYTLRYGRALLAGVRHRSLLNRNKPVAATKSGKSVYILGNGPSLNNFDLSTVYDSDVITMNYFHLHPQLEQFNIVAHCIGEPFSSDSWINPDAMVENTPAQSYWFNLDANRFAEGRYSGRQIHYYLPGVAADFDVLSTADLSAPTLQYQSTAQMAIMIAMYLGYADVYLLGFDHDWLATRGYSPHFYAEEGTDSGIVKADFSGISYKTMIEISKNLFDVYAAIRKISLRLGVNIVNLSEPTFLDIFPTRDSRHAR